MYCIDRSGEKALKSDNNREAVQFFTQAQVRYCMSVFLICMYVWLSFCLCLCPSVGLSVRHILTHAESLPPHQSSLDGYVSSHRIPPSTTSRPLTSAAPPSSSV